VNCWITAGGEGHVKLLDSHVIFSLLLLVDGPWVCTVLGSVLVFFLCLLSVLFIWSL